MKDYAALAQQVAARSRERQGRLREIYHDAKTESRALREMAESGKIEVKQREEIKEIVSWKIPGFVPSPRPLAKYIVSIADIQPGMSVLEPSAGAGHIADEVPKDASLICVERNYHLAEVLRGKGYKTVYTDFLTWKPGQKFDRILMNPPFEKIADIDHVMRAYNHLAAAGKMVAIMGAGAFFRCDKKAVAFRAWLDSRGEAEPLPDKIFLASERPTGMLMARQSPKARRLIRQHLYADSLPRFAVSRIGEFGKGRRHTNQWDRVSKKSSAASKKYATESTGETKACLVKKAHGKNNQI